MVGLALGMYLVFTLYRFTAPPDEQDDAARNTRPDSDRGETA